MGLPYRGPAPTADDQILTRGQAKLLAGYMTSTQRLALTGADLWQGRIVRETDTGIAYRYSTTATPAGWYYWDYPAVPVATYGTFMNGAQSSSGRVMELSVASGVATFAWALEKAGGMANNTVYFNLKTSFRPSGTLFLTGVTLASTSGITAVVIDVNGNVYVFFSTGASGIDSFAGSASFRISPA